MPKTETYTCDKLEGLDVAKLPDTTRRCYRPVDSRDALRLTLTLQRRKALTEAGAGSAATVMFYGVACASYWLSRQSVRRMIEAAEDDADAAKARNEGEGGD
jgi:hypothetical protein